MPNFAALAERKNQLIRKALAGGVFIAPDTAGLITALTGSDSLLAALPTGYRHLGWLSDDGLSFSSDVTTSDVTSWGSLEPTRRDITQKTTTFSFTAQETSRATLELYLGQDLSAATPDATSGELRIEESTRPATKYWRTLALATDGAADEEIYVARYMPRTAVSDIGDQTFSGGDDPIGWNVTMTAYLDSDAGFATAYIFGGPGWEALLADMDFA
jgi:hypothetical protein